MTACTLTATWQLPILPKVPEYCRATHADTVTSLAWPVSSMTHACGSITPIANRANVFHRNHVPWRAGDELLQPLVIHPQPGGHRLHRLPPTVQHQPPQVQPAGGPLIRPRQRGENLPREGVKLLADRGETAASIPNSTRKPLQRNVDTPT